MSAELDHIFICVSPDAHEAGQLQKFGLTEGTPNTHPSQGTSCRRFFFGNAYLELLWVHDAAEAQSEPARQVHLWERWSGRGKGACPFGFCFRPASSATPPFPIRDYPAPYLPLNLSIGVGTNAGITTEPGLFWLGFARRPDRDRNANSQPREHSIGLRQITRVELISPCANRPSAELNAVVETGLIQLSTGDLFRVELGFDLERQGKSADFGSDFPLTLRW